MTPRLISRYSFFCIFPFIQGSFMRKFFFVLILSLLAGFRLRCELALKRVDFRHSYEISF